MSEIVARENGEKSAKASKPRVRRGSAITRALGDMTLRGKATWIYGLLFIESDPGVDAVENLIKTKLLQVPRFRSVYKRGKFYEVPVEEIDMDYHLVPTFEDSVPSFDSVLEFIGTLYDEKHYDLSKPLWKYYYIPKLEDGRALLVACINHTIGDGVSNVAVLYHLMDDFDPSAKSSDKPDTTKAPKKKKKKKSYLNLKEKIGWFLWGVNDGLTGTIDKFDSRSALRLKNVFKPSSEKKCAFTKPIDLERVKDLKENFPGATVNDVLLAVLSMAVREYLAEKDGEKSLKRRTLFRSKPLIRGNFPVNLRNMRKPVLRDMDTSNDWGVAAFRFPLAYKSRIDCMYGVKKQLDGIKTSPSPAIQKVAIKAISTPVLPRKQVLDRLLALNNKVTVMLSNVPGPRDEVTVCGKALDDLQFLMFSPLGLYLGLISYNNKVSVSIAMDSQLGDPADLAKFWDTEFDIFAQEVEDMKNANHVNDVSL